MTVRSPCWLFRVRSLTCQHDTFTVGKQAQGRPCQCNSCLQGISCDAGEGQGSALPPALCMTFDSMRARQPLIMTGPGSHLTSCISVSVLQLPACLSPDSGAAGHWLCVLDPMLTLMLQGPACQYRQACPALSANQQLGVSPAALAGSKESPSLAALPGPQGRRWALSVPMGSRGP